MNIGKRVRLERITDRKSGNTVIIPLDHGITIGPVEGIADLPSTVDKIADGGANAVLQQKGMVIHGHRGYGHDIGLITHLNASTSLAPDPNDKVAVCEPEEAIRIGTDAVSVHINIGSETESQQLKLLGSLSQKCDYWGLPLIAMMYPRGKAIKDQHDVDTVAHVARVGAELGADIIKTNYTGSESSFKKVIDGCPVPVVIAGGPKLDTDEDLLQMARSAIDAGGMGVAFGRNVFQHSNPTAMVRALCAIVHKGASVKEAMGELK